MSSRTWMFVLGVTGAAGLGVGLPVVALTTTQAAPATWVTGVVTQVDAAHGRIRLHPAGDAVVEVVLAPGVEVGTPAGPEPLARLGGGERVRAQVARDGGPALRVDLVRP